MLTSKDSRQHRPALKPKLNETENQNAAARSATGEKTGGTQLRRHACRAVIIWFFS